MRIRIDGVEIAVATEARLALRLAGFVLVDYPKEADYVIALDESDDSNDVVIGSADGPLERDVINRLAVSAPLLVLDRSGAKNDQALSITIPHDDALRRAVSRTLVEIFLEYVNRPALAPLKTQTPRTLAIAVTLDRLVQHLIDTEPTAEQIARRLRQAMNPPWWQFWRRRGE